MLTVSRAIPGKGLDLLVEAFLALDAPGCRLTIAGDGPELDSLRRAAAGDERVRLLGSVPTDRVADLFRSSDVFAFPSSIDAFGLVLVEAFAAGLAVAVAPEPGAVGDLAVTERNCVVVDERTPSAWAKALGRLIEDPGLREALGTEARRSVEDRWTVAHSADCLLSGLALGRLVRDAPAGRRPDRATAPAEPGPEHQATVPVSR